MALAFRSVSKSYGEKVILDNVSFTLNTGERVGLVGANGVGKSTLLKMVMGDVEIDGGEVVVPPGVEVGYLPQTFDFADELTIAELIFQSQRELRELETRIRELADRMADTSGAELDRVMEEYGDLSARFEQRGGYEMEYRTELVLEGLRLGHVAKERRLSTLSGGQKTRVGLAALLISAPDLMLLDEPTNHLDFATLAWLEEYLSGYGGALLFTSHDRQFLNRTATRILEVDEYKHVIKEYVGNYDHFMVQKQRERIRWEEDYVRQQEEIKELKLRMKETGHQVAHNRAPKDKNKMAYNKHGAAVQSAVSRNVRSAEKALERIYKEKIPMPPQPMRFKADFNPEALHNKTAMMVANVYKSFADGTELFKGISFSLDSKSRILILGENGTGKTTLLNLLAGKVEASEGTVFVAPEIKLGYLQQEDSYPFPEETVLEAFRKDLVGYRDEHVAKLLSYQLFTYEEMERKVGQLSPGQYRKLQIAKIMSSDANLLLIDEPTNHITFDVLEEFEQALERFPGPVLTVSHDRWFINRFRGEVWTLEKGTLVQKDTNLHSNNFHSIP
ncbi:MAG: ribosomal protection-like ABC-F family protein [Tumebacillaceae bacterium]